MMRVLLWGFADDQDMTAEEVADACGYTAAQGAWKRVSDLATQGLIADTGTRRLGRSGRYQIVWRITDAGWMALALAHGKP